MTKITDMKKLKKLLLAKLKLESALEETKKAIAETHPGRLPRWQLIRTKRPSRDVHQGTCFKHFSEAIIFLEIEKKLYPLEKCWIEPLDPKKS